MSSKEKGVKNPENKEFNIEVDSQNTTYDLNKIFHIDLSYNFDLLKDLLSTIIKNQKLKDDKILDLENQLIEFKNYFNESLKDPESIKKIQESKTKVSTLLLKEIPNTSCLHYVIRPPPNHIVLETNSKNDPVVNQIIVSLIIFTYNNNLIIEKIEWI